MTTSLSIAVFQKRERRTQSRSSRPGKSLKKRTLAAAPSRGVDRSAFLKLREVSPTVAGLLEAYHARMVQIVAATLCSHSVSCVVCSKGLKMADGNSSASVRMYWKEDGDDSLKTREDDGEKFNPAVSAIGFYTASRSGLRLSRVVVFIASLFVVGSLGTFPLLYPDFYPPEFWRISRGEIGGEGGGGRGTGKIKRRRVSRSGRPARRALSSIV